MAAGRSVRLDCRPLAGRAGGAGVINVTDGWAGDWGFRKWNPFANKHAN